MPRFYPQTPVDSYRVIRLVEDGRAAWKYTLPQGKTFASGATASLKISNIQGTLIKTWSCTVSGNNTVSFDQSVTEANGVTDGASWQLYVTASGVTRVIAQGIFVRSDVA